MTNKLKITFCIPTLGSGGAERVISILSKELTALGFDINILMLSNEKCKYQLDPRVKLHCIHCDDDAALSPVKRCFKRLSKIKGAIKELAPDVVVSFMSETNIDVCLALWNKKIPIIVSERNDPAIDPASRAKKILRKIAYRKPKHFVFQTPDAKAYFSKRIGKKSSIILNPLDKGLISPCDASEKDKRIVAVGRLNRQKNFPLLIKAFGDFSKTHPEHTLEIYGEGALEEELLRLISEEQLNDKVSLMGFCKDVHEKILTAGMFVMSSDFEGMPNALLEALALGLSCISTDCPCGGPRMLINSGENGILVPIRNQEELTKAMTFLADSPEEAASMAKKAREVRKIADTESVVNTWANIIRNV